MLASIPVYEPFPTIPPHLFRTIVNTYYRGAHGVCLVYDITDIDSFQRLNSWLKDVTELAEPKCQKLIVGTKLDMDHKRQVSLGCRCC